MAYEFDFAGSPSQSSYAIYAPNGFMKSSFARTFEDISKGESPKDERYQRQTVCKILRDGANIDPASIYVFRSEIDKNEDTASVSNILVDANDKARYDSLVLNLEKLKKRLEINLNRVTGVRKEDIAKQIQEDFGESQFHACIETALKAKTPDIDLSKFKYATLFNTSVLEVINSEIFINNAKKFSEYYLKLIEKSGGLYARGKYNPSGARDSLSGLKKQGYFGVGHKVHINGDPSSITEKEFETRIAKANAIIDEDKTLAALKDKLSSKKEPQAITELIEGLENTELDYFIKTIAPSNRVEFKKEIWSYWIQKEDAAKDYINDYNNSKAEIDKIETKGSQVTREWEAAIKLFNDRFIGMPFELSVSNPSDARLGRKPARLIYVFKDGADTRQYQRSDIKTLSQGERRALHILNFIFDVEARKKDKQETLFIIDDIADSFDYKNKYAIVQYLSDLNAVGLFSQIILTHNFDFLRTIQGSVVPYKNCLMANKSKNGVSLEKALGIKNIFIGDLKNNISRDNQTLIGTIPFTRNIIEYTNDESDETYKQLTDYLHWKRNTPSKTISEYLTIFNTLYQKNETTTQTDPYIDILFNTASQICNNPTVPGLSITDKVVLSIAIRIKAEQKLLDAIRNLRNDSSYWCESEGQYQNLLNELKRTSPNDSNIPLFEQVSMTVSSNIHLNSFMYEPILDMTKEHLVDLYIKISTLK